jgi:hypothetical protein
MHFLVRCKGKMERHRAAGELAGWENMEAWHCTIILTVFL